MNFVNFWKEFVKPNVTIYAKIAEKSFPLRKNSFNIKSKTLLIKVCIRENI